MKRRSFLKYLGFTSATALSIPILAKTLSKEKSLKIKEPVKDIAGKAGDVWDGKKWVTPSIVSTKPSKNPNAGDVWINQRTGVMYIFNGHKWREL